jgi:hypothetical protein
VLQEINADEIRMKCPKCGFEINEDKHYESPDYLKFVSTKPNIFEGFKASFISYMIDATLRKADMILAEREYEKREELRRLDKLRINDVDLYLAELGLEESDMVILPERHAPIIDTIAPVPESDAKPTKKAKAAERAKNYRKRKKLEKNAMHDIQYQNDLTEAMIEQGVDPVKAEMKAEEIFVENIVNQEPTKSKRKKKR